MVAIGGGCFRGTGTEDEVLSARFVQVNHGTAVFTDASGWGCGGQWGDEWFQFESPREWVEKSIALKELVPVVMACAMWGRQWGQRLVRIRTDNRSVVDVMHSYSSQDSYHAPLEVCIVYCRMLPVSAAGGAHSGSPEHCC